MTCPAPAVLLAQLGTPAAPTAKALRPYLRQFLGDPRVIEANRVLWWLVLNAIVPKEFVEILQALVLMCVIVIGQMMRSWMRRRPAPAPPKSGAVAPAAAPSLEG